MLVFLFTPNSTMQLTGVDMDVWRFLFRFLCLYFTILKGSTVQRDVLTDGTATCDILPNEYINCSHRSLHSIHTHTLPHTALSIDFSYNNVTNISGYTFYPLTDLVWLDLSHNRIKHLDRFAFMNLSKLEFLNLNSNRLLLSSTTYPPDVFKPLVNLAEFHVEDNVCWKADPHQEFPTAMASLTNLKEFYTDFSPLLDFAKQFSAMKKLETLSSSGFAIPNKQNHKCCVRKVYENTFNAFLDINITHFRLSDSCISYLHSNALSPMQNVKILHLGGNQHLGLNQTLASLRGLVNKTITHVDMSRSNDFALRSKIDVTLPRSSLRYLSSMCIQSLDISNNYIVFLIRFTLSRADCLQELNLSGHSTDVRVLWRQIVLRRSFPNLRSLNISVLNGPRRINHNEEIKQTEHIPLHQLTTVDMSFLPMSCDFQNTQFRSVKVANISGWNCSSFNLPTVLLMMQNVTRLTMRQTNLADGLATYGNNNTIFRNMVLLDYLDISENQLTYIPDDLFSQNKNLKSLSLSNNKLSGITQDLLQGTNYNYLDLSFNVIQWLMEKEIEYLDNHKSKHPDFHIVLGNNPFVCSCISIHFLEWLNRTSVVIDFGNHFKCRFLNGSQVRIVDVLHQFKVFSVPCVSTLWLTIAIAAILVVIPLIVCVLGYYRRRWNIHYWFYTHCKPTEDMLPERNHQYDVFVAYNHNDSDWVHHNLREYMEGPERSIRLCLHHRDFEVGQVIQQNIVDSINNSRKVLLVISRNFVRSTWGEYEIEMAAMRSVQEAISNVIVCVLLEEIPIGEMPRTLMNLWQRVTFLIWPETCLEQNLFWERLYNAFG